MVTGVTKHQSSTKFAKRITLCMPPHSSHLLQPLDIGCFAVLKHAYGERVREKMKFPRERIDKLDFLDALLHARDEAYKSDTIISSFGSAGLVPFDPERVYCKLSIRCRTSGPQIHEDANEAPL